MYFENIVRYQCNEKKEKDQNVFLTENAIDMNNQMIFLLKSKVHFRICS